MDDTRRRITGRLRKVEGQIRGIQRMVEEHRDCEDILIQIMAARTALDRVTAQVVAAHVDDCLLSKSSTEAQRAITRAVQLLGRAT